VTLRRELGEQLPAGTRLPLVTVDWLKGAVCVYEDPEDALNGAPALSLTGLFLEQPLESAGQYLHETLALLRRGHSLLSPRCTCAHSLGEARARALGITTLRDPMQRCELPTVPREFSAAELSQELGLTDLCACNTHTGEPLVVMLQRHNIRVRIAAPQLFFSLASHFVGPVRCREDLLRKLDCHALPFELDHVGYPALGQDLAALEADATICVLVRGPPLWLVYRLPASCPIARPVDPDIRALWHGAAFTPADRLLLLPLKRKRGEQQ
jgi:hypothetical protein